MGLSSAGSSQPLNLTRMLLKMAIISAICFPSRPSLFLQSALTLPLDFFNSLVPAFPKRFTTPSLPSRYPGGDIAAIAAPSLLPGCLLSPPRTSSLPSGSFHSLIRRLLFDLPPSLPHDAHSSNVGHIVPKLNRCQRISSKSWP